MAEIKGVYYFFFVMVFLAVIGAYIYIAIRFSSIEQHLINESESMTGPIATGPTGPIGPPGLDANADSRQGPIGPPGKLIGGTTIQEYVFQSDQLYYFTYGDVRNVRFFQAQLSGWDATKSPISLVARIKDVNFSVKWYDDDVIYPFATILMPSSKSVIPDDITNNTANVAAFDFSIIQTEPNYTYRGEFSPTGDFIGGWRLLISVDAIERSFFKSGYEGLILNDATPIELRPDTEFILTYIST